MEKREESLRDKALKRLRNSRVSNEAQNISGQFFAGTIWGEIAIVATHAALICVALYFAAEVLATYFGNHCLAPCPLSGPCCALTPALAIKEFLLLLIAGAASALSTFFTKGNKLQRSTLLTVIALAIIFFRLRPLGVFHQLVLALLTMLALFYGYRIGLYFQNRTRNS